MLQKAFLIRDGDIIYDGQMLSIFVQADATTMWDNWNLESVRLSVCKTNRFGTSTKILRRHQKHGQNLIDTAQPAGINLAVVDRLILQQLFEHYTVLANFTGSDPDAIGLKSVSDLSVPEDVVWRRRFFDETDRNSI